MIDKDEYPQTAELERRCVQHPGRPLARRRVRRRDRLLHYGLERSVHARRAGAASGAGATDVKPPARPADRPNLVMGANVQVCWEKFCRYWDVEPCFVPVGPESTCPDRRRRQPLTATRTPSASSPSSAPTFDGGLRTGRRDLPCPRRSRGRQGHRRADPRRRRVRRFRRAVHRPGCRVGLPLLPRVQSINASGHKYGLVYPGVGWIVWRYRAALPEELDLRRRLPRRPDADLRVEFLAAREHRSSRSITTSSGSAPTATGWCNRNLVISPSG